MTRPVRPDEKPRFGQIWSWGDEGTNPLMAVSPVEPDGAPLDLGYRWRFLSLDGSPTVASWWWCDRNGQPFDDWTLLDE